MGSHVPPIRHAQPSEFIDINSYLFRDINQNDKNKHAKAVSEQSRLYKGLEERGKSCHVETVLNFCYFRRRFVRDYYNAV